MPRASIELTHVSGENLLYVRSSTVIHSTSAVFQGKKREFYFDYAFGPRSTQEAVYTTVGAPIVADVLRGQNGTILAYGQTGTGKTYTMVRLST
jgi:hypothetical protein